MGALTFLFAAVLLSAIGLIVLWARNRASDTAESSIDEFERTRRALSDDSLLPGQQLPREWTGDDRGEG